VAILGGAKVSDKIEVVENLMKIADAMLIGGGMAYTFLKAQGLQIGKSLVEDDKLDLAKKILSDAAARKFRLLLPVDNVVAPEAKPDAPTAVLDVRSMPADKMGLDIGPKTVASYEAEIAQAKTIVWNGPMGVFEVSPFSKGTFKIARAVADNPGAISIVGGGDSVSAVHAAGVAGQHLDGAGGPDREGRAARAGRIQGHSRPGGRRQQKQ
jgi:phosphoglycerate kinase